MDAITYIIVIQNHNPSKLVAKLADIYGVNTENLLVTRGSDEGIDLLFRLYCEYQKDSVFTVEPTFGMYRIAAQLQGVEYHTINLQEADDFELNTQEFMDNIPANCKIAFLCSPNNPTGKIMLLSSIEYILNQLSGKCIVIVDEAYIEFSNTASATTLIDKHENLVVLRTLSKSFGMAGLRLGTVITNTNRIAWLRKILAPYPIPKTTETTVLKLLDDKNLGEITKNVSLIKTQRDILFTKISKLPLVDKLWQSDANFILVRFNSEIFAKLIENKIVVRSMSHFFDDEKTVRISIGTIFENEKLITVLEKLSDEYENKINIYLSIEMAH